MFLRAVTIDTDLDCAKLSCLFSPLLAVLPRNSASSNSCHMADCFQVQAVVALVGIGLAFDVATRFDDS